MVKRHGQWVPEKNPQPIKYKAVNGVLYHHETCDDLILILEMIRRNGTKVVVFYGDRETGDKWKTKNGVSGRIYVSDVKLPVMYENSKSVAGYPILDHRILKIEYKYPNGMKQSRRPIERILYQYLK